MAGSQCCANPPALNPCSGEGHVETLGGLSAYVTGSPDSKVGILLITDVYGYEAPNLRKLADKIAATGFYVAVPDFLHGEPYVPNDPERPLTAWLKDHPTDKVFEESKLVIDDIKTKGISTLGVGGVCYGAKAVVELAKVGCIQAAVLMHPSFVSLDDIKGVKVPISILGAEIDQISPPALLKEFEQALAAKPEVDSFVKIFPKVSHGWTVRYNVEDEAEVKCAEEAHQDLLQWFTKHLK